MTKQEHVYLKITWIGGDKQWMTMDDMRLHDPHLVIRYALKNKLTDNPGWEWTKHYVDSDKTLTIMVHAFNSSRYLKNIKFGVEVPTSTNHALRIDQEEGTGL